MHANDVDLDSCAREPIHVPGSVQPHGALLVLDPADLRILQVSANVADIAGTDAAGIVAVLSPELAAWKASGSLPTRLVAPGYPLDIAVHLHDGRVIVELERAASEAMDDPFARLTAFAQQMAGNIDLGDALSAAARLIVQLSNFDRALVYRFDADWNGHVVAEAGNGTLPSYLDLRFPAGDIPAQARDLYRLNPLRLIPDADYTPVPLLALDEEQGRAPVDMTFTQIRSVSPVHLEYMRNMGTLSSMSISILIDGRLWGLLACHSRQPHIVPVRVRDACNFIAQSLAMQIGAASRAETAAIGVELGRLHTKLLASMADAERWDDGLANAPDTLLALTRASGAAILSQNGFSRVGDAPDEEAVRRLTQWLSENGIASDVYATDCLAAAGFDDRSVTETACGILACRISESDDNWLVWFRPEVIRTVTWGGDPHKVVRESGRIHPRKSFEAWRESVRDRSAPWHEAEIGAAHDLRASIVEIVLKKAEQLARLAADLQKSNKELEAFSYSISHDLRAPFRHIVGFSQLLTERERNLDERSRHYLKMISDSALAAGELVDDLLTFSHLGRATLATGKVDMNKLVEEVRLGLAEDIKDRAIEWRVGDLPMTRGDGALLRQVWHNMIENAVKYTRPREPARIDISGEPVDGGLLYRVQDNGVGFDMAYKAKLFGVFQRLQRSEDFEGTGIGLALVKRIVERHGGSVDATGTVDGGACFTFFLPVLPEE
ncbi:ATP-binding protein [Shinella oryzae]|uniref:histidine kinase n=1 Tax=Shinella oryzae TaxID=2871820 RepID=A0ABY9KC71_9HYPH|nr:ATP-binding protein [Shinella oryzae]WLS05574.1 ATP-binding protein [Shinella oryzae]